MAKVEGWYYDINYQTHLFLMYIHSHWNVVKNSIPSFSYFSWSISQYFIPIDSNKSLFLLVYPSNLFFPYYSFT